MNYRLPGNRTTRILLITGTLLAVIVAIEWFLLQGTETNAWHEPQPAAADDGELDLDRYTPPGIEAFDEIVARPLFIEGREPPDESQMTQPAQQTAAPVAFTLELEGVAITPETRVAVVREIKTRKLLRLTEGMEHEGWKLENVNASGAVFTNKAQVHELSLEIETEPDGAGPVNNVNKRTRAPVRQRNYAGKPVTLDQIRIKKQTPPPAPTLMVPAP